MVQFVFTPWRNRAELLHVRQQLFPASSFFTTSSNNPTRVSAAPPAPPTSSSTTTAIPPESWWANPTELYEIERAIARIFMWVHRGGCPHVVESTALMMAAMVFDARGPHDAVAQAAVVSGYLVGFTRYVIFRPFFLPFPHWLMYIYIPTRGLCYKRTIINNDAYAHTDLSRVFWIVIKTRRAN